jgi:prepilin-type N-terminal cleavage/methylation domain-containing protein
MKWRTPTRGFTIIEALIASAIIAVLATVIYISADDARGKARDTQRINDLQQIAVAVRLYAEANNNYPTNNGQLGQGGAIDTALAPYLADVMADPMHDGSSFYYYYDDSVSCNGRTYPVVYAYAMETIEFQGAGAPGCAGNAGRSQAYTVTVGRGS